ncbi:rhodanese-like domain-containing protein [Alkaliphilus hydrothermalis]|uniref:Rhodanese-related sulfurtransferase n=1 Tax=Alkaliphilus hydrothermalis TaxID=1482730 RepID=A0ABS2NP87_9FIRM|nr:rhodanese-like domain-containing protein [Alkaliphilus hydrothermalis]MBM7614760.1 rhodanese-related sulfurtransferase [Alkaliphilus hydrothermalis]
MRIFVFRKRDLYITIGVVIALIIGLIILGQLSEERPVSSNSQLKYNYQKLLPEEANIFIQNNPQIVILDVRSQQDYNQGHISNAQFVPYKDLKAQMATLSPDDTYLIYCDNGKESLKASKLMAESGFPRVFALIGGYQKWPYEIKKVH